MANFLLADDHSIVRTGIGALVAEHFPGASIHEAADGNEILKQLRGKPIDLLILDIGMPDTDFAKLIEWASSATPQTRILVFTAQSEDIYGVRSLKLGASGFLQKTASQEEIIRAIQRVLDGKKYISPALAELLYDNKNGKTEMSNPFDQLSERELGIAILLNSGKSLPEICDILHIQYSTANTHKRRLFEKLNVHNILSLARLMAAYQVQA